MNDWVAAQEWTVPPMGRWSVLRKVEEGLRNKLISNSSTASASVPALTALSVACALRVIS